MNLTRGRVRYIRSTAT